MRPTANQALTGAWPTMRFSDVYPGSPIAKGSPAPATQAASGSPVSVVGFPFDKMRDHSGAVILLAALAVLVAIRLVFEWAQ